MNADIAVVIPAYNEERRLGATLDAILAYFDARGAAVELIVVDDGSIDATSEIVQQCAARRPEVRLLSYAANRGKGHAVRYGMLRARAPRALLCDADLATPIEEIEKLEERLEAGYDIAIGSRDVRGSQLLRRQSFVREMGGRTFNKLVQLMAVPGIHDTQCGFKLFTRAAAQSVFSRCRVDSFAFDVEALYVAMRIFGLRVAEVPVRWAHQDGSKVRFLRDAWRMIVTLFRIRLTRYTASPQPADLPVR